MRYRYIVGLLDLAYVLMLVAYVLMLTTAAGVLAYFAVRALIGGGS
jgi:hypothetical protein